MKLTKTYSVCDAFSKDGLDKRAAEALLDHVALEQEVDLAVAELLLSLPRVLRMDRREVREQAVEHEWLSGKRMRCDLPVLGHLVEQTRKLPLFLRFVLRECSLEPTQLCGDRLVIRLELATRLY